MLFTAPLFIFAFLPISLGFCLAFGKKQKRLSLALIGVAYYILSSIGTPINLMWMPLLIVYAYFSARMLELSKKRFLGILLGILPLVWLILMRQLAYYDGIYAYPVGITLPAMCVSAYVWDVYYGEKAESNICRLGVYFLYFPIMLIGPFVGYSKFNGILDTETDEWVLTDTSWGIRLFIIGFIKRIAVGAVLIEGYEKILEYSWETPDAAIILLLLILVYFGVFFSLSGYYDMAVGISRMYGVGIDAVQANPLTVSTANEYSNALFGGVRVWAEKYIVIPMSRYRGKIMPKWLQLAVYTLCTLTFIRSDAVSLLLSLPLVAFCLGSACLKLDKKYKQGRTGLRAVFGLVTVLVFGIFWIFMTVGSLERSVLEYLADMNSGNAEYQTDMVLISFSVLKYLCVILIGLVTLLPQATWAARGYNKLGNKTRSWISYLWLSVLLALFVFTVVFFLPQYAEYNYAPFKYIVI